MSIWKIFFTKLFLTTVSDLLHSVDGSLKGHSGDLKLMVSPRRGKLEVWTVDSRSTERSESPAVDAPGAWKRKTKEYVTPAQITF